MMALSCPFKEDHPVLPLSTPLSSRQSISLSLWVTFVYRLGVFVHGNSSNIFVCLFVCFALSGNSDRVQMDGEQGRRTAEGGEDGALRLWGGHWWDMDRGLLRHDGLIHQICNLVTLFNSFRSPKCTCPMNDSFVEIWVAPTQRCCLLLEKSCYFFYLVYVFGCAVPCQCVWLRGAWEPFHETSHACTAS